VWKKERRTARPLPTALSRRATNLLTTNTVFPQNIRCGLILDFDAVYELEGSWLSLSLCLSCMLVGVSLLGREREVWVAVGRREREREKSVSVDPYAAACHTHPTPCFLARTAVSPISPNV